jgi:hypothetical protein
MAGSFEMASEMATESELKFIKSFVSSMSLELDGGAEIFDEIVRLTVWRPGAAKRVVAFFKEGLRISMILSYSGLVLMRDTILDEIKREDERAFVAKKTRKF